MPYNPRVHDRRSIRLPSFDYRRPGAYFVTVCSYLKEPLFGSVGGGSVHLTPFGREVVRAWVETTRLRADVATDRYVVMPNHFHGIIWLRRTVGAQRAAPLHPREAPLSNVRPDSLGAIVRAFKSASTKRINGLRGTPGSPVWQRNYYDRILRNDTELRRARQYILGNPLKWPDDPNHVPAPRT